MLARDSSGSFRFEEDNIFRFTVLLRLLEHVQFKHVSISVELLGFLFLTSKWFLKEDMDL